MLTKRSAWLVQVERTFGNQTRANNSWVAVAVRLLRQCSHRKKTVVSMRIQFGVGRLMVLTTAVAIILAISIRSQSPMLSKWILVSYFVCITIWLVIRGPNIVAGLVEVSRKRTEVKKRRAEIEREIMERKQKSRANSQK